MMALRSASTTSSSSWWRRANSSLAPCSEARALLNSWTRAPTNSAWDPVVGRRRGGAYDTASSRSQANDDVAPRTKRPPVHGVGEGRVHDWLATVHVTTYGRRVNASTHRRNGFRCSVEPRGRPATGQRPEPGVLG